jgi:hypothetical protein
LEILKTMFNWQKYMRIDTFKSFKNVIVSDKNT